VVALIGFELVGLTIRGGQRSRLADKATLCYNDSAKWVCKKEMSFMHLFHKSRMAAGILFLSALFHKLRHNAYHASARLVRCLCEAFHQSLVRSAENNGVSFFGTPTPQGSGCLVKAWVDVGICRTKYSYVHLR